MKRLPDEFLEELRQRVDIVDVVSEYVELRRAGRSFVGLCPFHNERSPSLSISSERQMFHCFGCGAGGTVIRFVMDIDGVSFHEAVVQLAERVNLDLPKGFEPEAPLDDETHNRRERIKEAHELATKLYNYILMNTDAGVQALTYLEQRGISRQTVMNFQIGYAPDGKNTLVRFLSRRGFSMNLLTDAGLAVQVGNDIIDRFRNRVMIPISDSRGENIAFGGRVLGDAKPKYLNSPDTEVFHKGTVLYNYASARKEVRRIKTVFLFEGYMDVIAASQAGVTNGVASLGTSLTPEQASMIRRDADTVVIAYDGDSAGVKAAERALEICEQERLNVHIVSFPKGMDPDEVIRKHGAEAFRSMLQKGAMSPVQFLLTRLRDQSDLLSRVGRTEFLQKAMQLIGKRATPIEQEVELRNLSQEFNLSVETLKEELRAFTKQISKRRFSSQEVVQRNESSRAPLMRADIRAGSYILQALMSDSQIHEHLMERDVDELADAEQTALLALLYGWRIQQPTGSVTTFIDDIDDASLRSRATALYVESPFEFSRELIDDCVRTLQLYRLQAELRVALQALIAAQTAGDDAKTRDIQMRVTALQQHIEAEKLPRLLGKGGPGVKEAGKK